MIVDAGPPAAEPDPQLVERAAAVLRSGQVVALPTDTVYGLAALPSVTGATAGLFALKGRSADTPLAVLCASADEALALADPAAIDDRVRRLASRLWPGPLTVVLPRRPGLGYELGEPASTIGVRCPDHHLIRALAGAVGPLATTSANLSGEPTPPTGAEVDALFGQSVGLVLDGGTCSAPPSAVVDATDATGAGWRLLRGGALDMSDIEAAAAP